MKLLWQAFAMELWRSFAYRTEFWLKVAGLLFAQVGVAYYLWKAIYAQSGASVIEGFSFRGMVLYYVLVPLIENISRPMNPGTQLAGEIYSGTLTRYLIYPLPFFPFKYSQALAASALAAAQLVIIVGFLAAVGFIPKEMTLTPVSIVMGLVAALFGSVLNFMMVMIIELVAFWADSVWSLNVMLQFCVRLLGGSLLPLVLFPASMQRLLPLTPFPYLVSFPIMTMIGHQDAVQWLTGLTVLVAWSAAFALILNLVWRRGCRQYAGVGQ